MKDLREIAHSPEVHSVFAPREHKEWTLVADAEFKDVPRGIPSEQEADDFTSLASELLTASPPVAFEVTTLDRIILVDGSPEPALRRVRVRRTDEAHVREETYRVNEISSSGARLTTEDVYVHAEGSSAEEATEGALRRLFDHIYSRTREFSRDIGSHKATPEGFGSDDRFPQNDPRHRERPFRFSQRGPTLRYQVNVFGEPREITFCSYDAVGYMENITVKLDKNEYGVITAHLRVDWVRDTGSHLVEYSRGEY